MERNKVVYLHRRTTDNSVFYVGMGSLKRAYNKQRSKWWWNIVNKNGYTVEIYKDELTQEEAFEIEIELIEKFGRIDTKTGILINRTKGGIAFNELSIQSKSTKSKSLRLVKRTDEWKNKISIANKGKSKSKEHRENMSKAKIGTKKPEHVKEKMRLSNKSKIISAVPIFCYDYNTTDFFLEFKSISDASRELGCLVTSICNNLSGRSKNVNSKKLNKKLIFKYKCR